MNTFSSQCKCNFSNHKAPSSKIKQSDARGKSESDIAEQIVAHLVWLILYGADDTKIDFPTSKDDVDYKFIKNQSLEAVGEVKRDVDEAFIEFDRLQSKGIIKVNIQLSPKLGSWSIHVDPSMRRAHIEDRKYVDLISTAINLGITTWQTGLTDPLPSPEFLNLADELGVSMLWCMNMDGPPYILMQRNLQSASFSDVPEGLEGWVQSVISKHESKRSYERFFEYQAPAAHIFVIIDSQTPENIRFWASMGTPSPFTFEPDLPPNATHLFIGTNIFSQAGERRVWMYQLGEGWSFYWV